MVSRSSRQKSDLNIKREFAVRLLQDGAIIESPSKELLEAALVLEKTRIIETRNREFVLCANPKDYDFPVNNRDCRGKIYIDDGLDESCHDFRCPECDRPVFPFQHRKQRFLELRTQINRDGVLSFLLASLESLNKKVSSIVDGVFRIEVGMLGVVLCIFDYCADNRFLAREWASHNTTCYLAVDSNGMKDRVLDEAWIMHTTLVDVLTGKINIAEWVQEAAGSRPPSDVKNASVPVYTRSPHPILAEPIAPIQPGRRFIVECGPNTVLVEGELVVSPQSATRYTVFSILWNRFIEDMKEQKSINAHKALKLKEIIEEVESRTEKRIDEEMTIRRAINRLQTDIETAVKKKLGLPIGREDIIQTLRWRGIGEGDFGYRINPSTVAARPFQSTKS